MARNKLIHNSGDKTRQLVVEGADDFHFLGHWLTDAGLLDNFCFQPAGNDKTVLTLFPVVLKQSEVKVVGIIIDADTDIQGRWDSIRQKLLKAGYPDESVPKRLPPRSFICDGNSLPKFGAWIMPNNQDAGYFETFAKHLIDDRDGLWTTAVESVNAIPKEMVRFRPADRDKVCVHTWLAWQRDPGMPLGQALKAKLFNLDSGLGQEFQTWLASLL